MPSKRSKIWNLQFGGASGTPHALVSIKVCHALKALRGKVAGTTKNTPGVHCQIPKSHEDVSTDMISVIIITGNSTATIITIMIIPIIAIIQISW